MVTDENQQEPLVVDSAPVADVDADSSNSLNDIAEFTQEEEIMEDSTSTTGECNSDDCPAEL